MKNTVGYLTKALREDYAKGAPAKAPEVSRRNPAKPSTLRARRLERIRDLAASRKPTQRDADKLLFIGRLSGAARDDFERHGWMSALNAEAIAAFWEELSPGAFDGLAEDGGSA